jgi:methylmalonyl-CoA/ethylmalonyl-CoA epimerase
MKYQSVIIDLPPMPSHLGIVTENIDRTVAFFCATLNVGRVKIIGEYAPSRDALVKGNPFRLKLALIKLGSMTLELLQPMEGRESPWFEFLENNGEGLHHIAYRVSNIDEVISDFAKKGIDITIGGQEPNSSKKWIYMNMGTNPGGLVIEIKNFDIWED